MADIIGWIGVCVSTVVNSMAIAGQVPHSALPDRAHVVQFYTDDNFLLDGLAMSFAGALKSGESVVAIMTKAHGKGLVKRLSVLGIDIGRTAAEGRLCLLDASDALKRFMERDGPNRQKFLREVGNTIRRAEAAAERKGKRVVAFGEMVAVLWKEKQCDAAIRLEQLWNELARTHFFHLHCAYPAKWFYGKHKGEPYATICAEHSVVITA
ncbi:MAG TPA: MEDS domain-containing protein [Terriglobales bacterium]|nr:MEDS domain-containing protein [Terriglobales bacterium]